MQKDCDKLLTMKQIKDSARLLLGTGRLVPGAEVGIKALVSLIAAIAPVAKVTP